MYREMTKMTTKQLEVVRNMTLVAYADGKMTAREKDLVLESMKRVLVDRISEKRGHKIKFQETHKLAGYYKKSA